MHIHLPKPLHGWRAFVGEVGIIVLGVLIALGGEQAMQGVHHRAQVHEMTNKLHAEGIANLSVLTFDNAVLRKALTEAEAGVVALNRCDTVDRASLQPLARPRYLLPANAAWLGLRDSALLPLMPDDLASSYWILDVSQSALRTDVEQVNNAFVQAAGVVEGVRGGASDKQICIEALISLERLKQAELALLQRTRFYGVYNEQVLHGQRLGPPREVVGAH